MYLIIIQVLVINIFQCYLFSCVIQFPVTLGFKANSWQKIYCIDSIALLMIVDLILSYCMLNLDFS